MNNHFKDKNTIIELRDLRRKVIREKNIHNDIVIYSANFGKYDTSSVALNREPGIDYLFFSDYESLSPPGWTLLRTGLFYRDPRRTAKILKIHPDYFLNTYDISVWIDANRHIYGNIKTLINTTMKDADISMFIHPKRSSVQEEAKTCIFWGKDDKKVIDSQILRYKKDSQIESLGLFSGAFIVRRHENIKVKLLMKEWWNEIDKYSVRDQISFPYCLSRSDVKFNIIPGDVNNNQYFFTVNHPQNKTYNVRLTTRIIALLAELITKIIRIYKKK